VLDVAYRNDAGAPLDPSHRYGYGATEWRDLEAAVQYARGHGAQQVVLFGSSMGGSIVASFLEHSASASAVRGVVLDAPALDFRATVDFGATQRSLPLGLPIPGVLTSVAEWIAGWRYHVEWAAVDYLPGDRLHAPPVAGHLTDDGLERGLDTILGNPGFRQPFRRVGQQCIDVNDVTRGDAKDRGRFRPVVAVDDGGWGGFESVHLRPACVSGGPREEREQGKAIYGHPLHRHETSADVTAFDRCAILPALGRECASRPAAASGGGPVGRMMVRAASGFCVPASVFEFVTHTAACALDSKYSTFCELGKVALGRGRAYQVARERRAFMADHTDGMNVHLAHRDVAFVAISRAPLGEIKRFRRRMD